VSQVVPQRYGTLSDALQVHVRLADFLARDPAADDIMDGFADSFTRSVQQAGRLGSGSESAGLLQARGALVPTSFALQKRAQRLMLDSIVHYAVQRAPTYWLSPEVQAEVSEAAALIEPEPLFPTDLPTPCGFLVVPHELAWWPDSVRIRAIVWMSTAVDEALTMATRDGAVGEDGISLWWLCDVAEAVERLWEPVKGEPMPDDAPARRMGLWPVDMHGWVFGRPWAEVAEIPPASTPGQVALPHTSYLRRWMLTLFRFTWQRLVRPEPWRPPRPEMRRAMRVLPIPDDGYIKVLHLRHVDYVRHDERDQDEGYRGVLAYRHWRRAHWRRIHAGTADERLVWVRGHWVGDETLPERQGYDVTGVTR
jgi:hypothetical protein